MIYLDHHSTTPVDPRVLEAMLPYFSQHCGNAASSHEMGEQAQEAVYKARESVARLIHGAKPEEIYFTPSATEANNIAILGTYAGIAKENSYKIYSGGYHQIFVLSSYIEHKSILASMDKLGHYSYGFVEPEKDGIIIPEKIEELINKVARFPDTTSKSKVDLISIIAANNEIGTIQDLVGIRNLCNKYDIIFHTDAAQAAGKVNLSTLHADLITLSSHKIYGPKGIGALYISNKVKHLVEPIVHGAYQEHISSGTLNTPAIVGFGKACDILIEESDPENERLKYLRDKFLDMLSVIKGLKVNGSMAYRLPHNLNISIDGIKAEAILNISDLCCSTGSACQNSGDFKPSHVIRAIGADDQSVRFGIGRFNTEAEIELAAQKIIQTVKEIRNEI